ncbi:MAG TPA: FAD-dependent oxidoreductase, partial [Kiritimatiellia bacterium]|nr:FAD-dependent oxidoreductase [Kiritimatiellia bacterium]HPK70060.1 FAD-dependent oxidoreductase [Kiritimatiellia bacterium]
MQTNENFSAAARARNLAQMGTGNFDVLVVGGGIQGATIAWATARRGLRVALVEAADWGAGASANSLKIIHGGLRYLQHANLVRMRESIRARR